MSLFSNLVARSLPFIPRSVVGRVAAPYVAGETEASALAVVAELNRGGMSATLDVLGEDITSREEAAAGAAAYVGLLDAIAASGVNANVSLKLTQFGLKLDRKVCVDNLRTVLVRARHHDNFVRIDMEDSSCTDHTLEIFRELRPDHPKLGVVLQAMLKRTPRDAEALAREQASVRLCKGIYVEPESLAHRDRVAVRRSYLDTLAILLQGGGYVGIATHDEVLIEGAYRLLQKHGIPPTGPYEFQMLLGVRPALRDAIVAAGHRLRVYVPFGNQWYAYSVRRLRENPAIAGHVAKAMVGRLFGGHG